MKKDEEHWPRFYAAEMALFDYLRANAECFYSETDLSYDEFVGDRGGVLSKPKKYIHWIGVMKGDEGPFLMLDTNMRLLYKTAMASRFKRYPSRFPQIFSDIEQFNISTQDAIESKLMPMSGLLVLKAYRQELIDDEKELEKSFKKDVRALHDIGMRLASYRVVEKSAIFRTSTVYELVVPMHEMLTFSGAQAIQRRKSTGKQYRVRMKRTDQEISEQVTFGLMVLTKSCEALTINHSKPKAKRSNALDELGQKIELPIESNYSFYRREPESDMFEVLTIP